MGDELERVGKYKILKKLGEGGFGAVYLGVDPLMDEEVAIKVFRVKDENLAAFGTSSDKEASDMRLVLYGNGADQSTDYDGRNKSCNDGYGKQTAPVGSFAPNAFGLYDMHGNVGEWVENC